MSVSAVTGTAGKSTTSSDSTARIVDQTLDKNDFLELMIKQMQYQDPLNPTSNEQFISQLAQFSSLEQTTNLNATMEAFTKNTMSLQAGNMIGWKVTGIDANGATVSGTVTGVKFSDGSPVLMVGTKELPLSGLSEMTI